MTTIWRFVSANEARSFLKDPGGVDWGNKGPQGAAEWVTFDHDVEKTRATIVRRQQNELLLARARDEVILKPLVEAQATFVAVTLRQMILAFPLKAARKMVGLPDEKAAKRFLDKVAHDLCKEPASFSSKIVDPDWLEKKPRGRSLKSCSWPHCLRRPALIADWAIPIIVGDQTNKSALE
jgi:hypothetical protein